MFASTQRTYMIHAESNIFKNNVISFVIDAVKQIIFKSIFK